MNTLVATPDPAEDKPEAEVWTVVPNRADFRRNGLLKPRAGRGRARRSKHG